MKKEEEKNDAGEEWLSEEASEEVFRKNKKLYEKLAKE